MYLFPVCIPTILSGQINTSSHNTYSISSPYSIPIKIMSILGSFFFLHTFLQTVISIYKFLALHPTPFPYKSPIVFFPITPMATALPHSLTQIPTIPQPTHILFHPHTPTHYIHPHSIHFNPYPSLYTRTHSCHSSSGLPS